MNEELRPCPFCGLKYAEHSWAEFGEEYWVEIPPEDWKMADIEFASMLPDLMLKDEDK